MIRYCVELYYQCTVKDSANYSDLDLLDTDLEQLEKKDQEK